MMKRDYISPAASVVELRLESQILTASGGKKLFKDSWDDELDTWEVETKTTNTDDDDEIF